MNNGQPIVAGMLTVVAMVMTSYSSAAIINVPGDQPTIQAAIIAANPGDEVVVAPGTYVELINFGGKAITVRSTDPEDPKVVMATIINGAAMGTVVTCSSGEGPGTVLEGFTITGGLGSFVAGGGMCNSGSSPTVNNCTFSGNLGGFVAGGGMSNSNGSSPIVTNCTFSGNVGGSAGGGGMSNHGGSNPIVTNCTFSGNVMSKGSGGGMSNSSSSPIVTDCMFIGNAVSSGSGGGMSNSSSSPIVTDCIFSENAVSSGSGGGMSNGSDSSPIVINCTFSSNTGEGMSNFSGNSPTVINCTFSNNTGGGMSNFSGNSPTVYNCTFSGNSGSGMSNFSGNSTTVFNCTFSGNSGVGIQNGSSNRVNGGGNILGGDEFVNRGELFPGTSSSDDSVARLTLGMTLINSGGTLVFDLGGTTPGSGHDQIVVLGPFQLNAGLRVELIKGFAPQLGDRFVVLTAQPLAGQFDVALLPGLPDGLFMRIEYNTGGAASGAGTGEVVIVVDSLATLFEGFGDLESVEQFPGTPTAVALGDFDGLNGNDLAITIPGKDPHVLVLLNAGSDTMGNWQGFVVLGTAQTAVGVDPSGIAVGLLDGDQLLDAAVTNAGDGTVSILINQGFDLKGNWLGLAPDPGPITVGVNPIAIVSSTKLNGDSFADLAVANAGGGSGEVVVLLGTGTGTFNILPAIAVSGVPSSLAVGEIDDEHKDLDDLVTATSSDSGTVTVSAIVNLGGGAFAVPIDLPIAEDAAPAAVMIADLDNVGLADIVTANRGIGTVSVILNDGGSVFRAAVGLPVGDQPRSITSIDLGSDGDFDIAVIVTNELGDPIVQVLRNDLSNGQLIFADAEELDAGANPVLLITGDLDGDLADDLIVINEGGGGAAAAGGNGGPTMSSVNVGLNEFCAADMDNSGSVGPLDFLTLLVAWGTNPGGPPDFNGDGSVDILDFLLLLRTWGPCL